MRQSRERPDHATAQSDTRGFCQIQYDLDSRRNVPHGLGQALSGRGAGPSRHGRRLLDRPHAGDEPRSFAQFVEATGHVTFAEIPPDPKDYPGRAAAHAEGGLAGLQPARASGRPA